MDAARYVVDALERAGVRHIVVAPGSRSAPLVYALAEAEADGRITTYVRIDERVAGFTALGLAQGSRGPAAVLTTSGTAVGNLMPAVMEANHSGTPLLVLSADRPEEMRGTGANQTTAQLDLFGEHVRFATDVAAGIDPIGAVATALSAAQGRLEGIPAGPVQVNLAFRDPLTPALDGSEWERLIPSGSHDSQAGRGSLAAVGPAETTGSHQLRTLEAEPVMVRPSTSHRTVVLAGHGAGPDAEYFARMLGLPLFAEPSSNARYGPNAVGPYRLLLDRFGPASAQPMERVVVFGRPTLSRPMAQLLARTDLERALYLPHPVAWFEAGRRPELVLTQWDQLVGFAGHGPDGWLEAWQDAARTAEQLLDTVLAETARPGKLSGPAVARQVWARLQQEAEQGPAVNLVLGSSNPVRDADLAGHPALTGAAYAATVFANRGLAGIDGTIATATGIALATGASTRVLLGDVTFLHDAGALLLGTGEHEADVQVIVLNDNGGGIFSVLEHGVLATAANYAAAVERFFGTPHVVDLAALAAAYGWGHTLAGTTAELAAALAAPVRGRSIVEVTATREGLRELHAQIASALNAS
ncbi:2-succinyl-5-enolpyruvyl-6-hydroxy-3-cyclohexene-1-carboxylic-acid synthase [Arthrobacter livingstonensis]|uniref:2-succinyl-5-enolpyruvyl-6-hydroxy-3-cyclohexene-1-carboxylate synthase n=1 Tax=Arthrobacter livingstonensis TaxID=670078 RepID=A0A2V5LBG9_9MICC|nr:2-succinyl-5-enolpyruvyl-6-hydroxy-3-cyclohexene-1-carboxylic-acid synthase [Arthrobacter livingstonensis]PYI67884.1 2-succinyl-5-enolpyruvyl-6-hydroxy-3-cyclohexene-1-carboxylic-acid synthase [Arthrobacter livingstonensis]